MHYNSLMEKLKLQYSLVVPVLFFLHFSMSILQADEIQNQEYKLEVNPQWYSTDDYAIKGSIGASKTHHRLDERTRVYTKPSIAYELHEEWSARVGVFAAYNNLDELDNTVELRPYVGLAYFHSFDETFLPIDVSSYFRVEDRIIYDANSWDHVDNLRLRLRAWSIYKLNPSTKDNSWHRIILGAELLRTYFQDDQSNFELDEHFKVETRLSLGIEKTLKESKKIRFDVSWRYQVPFNEIENFKFNTVVFTIKYFPVWGDIFRNKLFHRLDE